jgi:RNA polymerase sigma factor (sigma-70 family)
MHTCDDANLLHAARGGDRRARDRVVEHYLPVVRSIAFRYRELGLGLDDLVQEGSLGLLEAIQRFDPSLSADFESFARFRIRRSIRNALTEQSRLIRLPKQVVERRRAIERAESRLRSATGRAPTPDEIAAATGLPLAAVAATRALGPAPVSLDQVVLEDGSPLEALVADGTARDPEDEAVQHEEIEKVEEAVACLPDRQHEIISRHFGLGCAAEQIGEVAETLHVSPQRARAIERDALYSLRKQLEGLLTPPRTG